MGTLTDYFNAVIPAAVFAVGAHNDISINDPANIYAERAVNFRHIIETGQIPLERPEYQYFEDTPVDWDRDDAYIRAVETGHDGAVQRLAETPKMQNLLDKDVWDREDRIEWERGLSEIVSEEIDKIEGLDRYRTADNAYITPGRQAEFKTTNLNDLSSDIENGTYLQEYDCDIMSITEGSIIQRIEDAYLPADSAIEGSFKQASPYYIGTGWFQAGSPFMNESSPGSHGFIVSSATGGIIEATADPSDGQAAYIPPVGDYDFTDYAAGKAFIDPDAGTYITDFGYFNDDWHATINDMLDNLQSEISAVEAYLEKHGQLPEIQAASEITRFNNDNGSITQDMATSLDELINESDASLEFNRIHEISNNISSYGGIIASAIHKYLDADVITPEEAKSYADQLNAHGEEAAALLEGIPHNHYIVDDTIMVNDMGQSIGWSYEAYINEMVHTTLAEKTELSAPQADQQKVTNSAQELTQ